MSANGVTGGVTVVIPTRDRPGQLRRCLEALALSALPPRRGLEVIVVDDGSEVPLDSVIGAAAGRLDVRLHRQENAGPASARNAGARLATYEHLAFTDDDCTPEPRWAATMDQHLRGDPDALVGGTTINAVDRIASATSQHLLDAIYRWQQSHPHHAFWTSNNLACGSALFAEVGGFDESFPLAAGEDRELGSRWARSGRPLHHATDARMHHHHDLGVRAFWRQHHNYGRGAHRFRELSSEADDHVRVLPPLFYWTLLSEPFRHAAPHRAVAMAGLVAMSQVATVAGFVREHRR